MDDRTILRELAARYAEFAFSEKNKEKIRLHRAVNDLEMERPIVLIDEIPWWELEKEEELILRCKDQDLRETEQMIRQALYKLRHMPADFAVPQYIGVPKIIHSTGIGVEVQEERLGEERGGVVSHSYQNVFREKGAEMLHDPVITYDEKETMRKWSKIGEAVGDIMPVKLVGEPTGYGLGCKTWDTIATLMGVNDLLLNLLENPELMHELADKLTDIFLHTLDQYVKLNLIDTDALALVGSGNEVATIMGLTKVAALAYLMFNLYTPPCFAALGAMNSEMKSGKWLFGGICLQLGTGYTVAFLVYQIGTLATTGSLGTGFVPGLIAVIVFALIILWRIRKSDKEFAAEYRLHAAA